MKKIIFLLLVFCAPVLAQRPQTRKIKNNDLIWDLQDRILKVVSDTTELKKKTLQDGYRIRLKQLSSSNSLGGGVFIQIDSIFAEGGVAFDNQIKGKQWVRDAFLEEKVVFPEWWGAVPDDPDVDNSPAINLAITTITNGVTGGTVLFNVGFYYIYEPIILAPPVILKGVTTTIPDARGTSIKLADNADTMMVQTPFAVADDGTGATHYMAIENITFLGNYENQTEENVAVDFSGTFITCYLRNVYIKNVFGTALRIRKCDMIGENIFVGTTVTSTYAVILGTTLNADSQTGIFLSQFFVENTYDDKTLTTNNTAIYIQRVSPVILDMVHIENATVGMFIDDNTLNVSMRNISATGDVDTLFYFNENPVYSMIIQQAHVLSPGKLLLTNFANIDTLTEIPNIRNRQRLSSWAYTGDSCFPVFIGGDDGFYMSKGNAAFNSSRIVNGGSGNILLGGSATNPPNTYNDLIQLYADTTGGIDATLKVKDGGGNIYFLTTGTRGSFSGTAVADTVLFAGIRAESTILVSALGSTITSNDVLSVEAKVDTFIVHRPAGGTSGLLYSWNLFKY